MERFLPNSYQFRLKQPSYLRILIRKRSICENYIYLTYQLGSDLSIAGVCTALLSPKGSFSSSTSSSDSSAFGAWVVGRGGGCGGAALGLLLSLPRFRLAKPAWASASLPFAVAT